MPKGVEAKMSAVERRSLRVLRMVHELHKRGFQGLRIFPGMSPSGMSWRCGITDAGNVSSDHGAWALDETQPRTIHYTSATDNEYFGWTDAKSDGAAELAAKFLERQATICELAKCRDWPYSGWYVEMLGLAEQGFFPVAYDDWHTATPDPRFLPTTRGISHLVLPMPPGGLGRSRAERR